MEALLRSQEAAKAQQEKHIKNPVLIKNRLPGLTVIRGNPGAAIREDQQSIITINQKNLTILHDHLQEDHITGETVVAVTGALQDLIQHQAIAVADHTPHRVAAAVVHIPHLHVQAVAVGAAEAAADHPGDRGVQVPVVEDREGNKAVQENC